LLAREKCPLKAISAFMVGGFTVFVRLCGSTSSNRPMISYLFSCENATCAVPDAYRDLFRESEELVTSVAGWEAGALNLAQAFSMRYRTPLVHGDVTRLLIDLESGGEARWSRFSLKLPETTRAKLIDRHERIYRGQLMQRIEDGLKRGSAVLHVLVHTSPGIDGRVLLETTDDLVPAKELAEAWRRRMKSAGLAASHESGALPNDLEAYLARGVGLPGYLQVRLTVSQSFFLEGRPLRWETVKKTLLDTLKEAADKVSAINDQECRETDPT
jgi:hypothetical protein